MQRPICAAALASALIAATLTAPAALAGGSIDLDEVLASATVSPKLAAEIAAARAAAGSAGRQVVCSAQRFGRHWRQLSGGRVLPYVCRIGDREITMEGEVAYLDAAGRVLDINDDALLLAQAASLRQTLDVWSWRGL